VTSLRSALERALEDATAGERWLVAFSGGPDSSALLATLARLAPQRGVEILALHVDHGLDPGSERRAERAREIAAAVGVPFESTRVVVARRRGESPEAAARRVRYGALEEHRRALGADRILTAHHADDQIETLLLRIAAGTTVFGLGGIAPRHGPLLRPLLEVPGAELRAAAREIVPPPVEDPTNLDLSVPRNRLRHALLPRLERGGPGLRDALAELPRCARGATARLERWLDRTVAPRRSPTGEPWLPRGEVAALPRALWARALARLLEAAELRPAPGPARLRAALGALERGTPFELRLDAVRLWGGSERIGVRLGESRGEAVSYTVSLPGEVELRELGLRMRITRERVAPWMFRGRPDRAAFDLPADVATAEVRCRRPGDRIRPLGSRGERKLKELLIDRKVPRELRSELPLLLVGGRIVWVPGVTIDEDFRLRGGPVAWMAALEPLAATVPDGNGRLSDEVGASERETT